MNVKDAGKRHQGDYGTIEEIEELRE
jgi:hypothetical protein